MSAHQRSLPRPTRRWNPRNGRTRVLVECTDPAVSWAAEATLQREGYDVAVCWGPSCFAEASCPLMSGGRCALVEGADVIVQSMPLAVRREFPVLARLRQTAPETPVCVEIAEPAQQRVGPALDRCRVIRSPMTPASLVEVVGHAARTGKPSTP